MRSQLFFVFLTLGGCVAQCHASVLIQTDDPTSGYIQMNADRQVFVYDDTTPSVSTVYLRSDSNYSLIVEQAGGLEPGERKRLRSSFGVYEMDNDGSYHIPIVILSSNGASESSTLTVSRNNLEYKCYNRMLFYKGFGHHILLLKKNTRLVNVLVYEYSIFLLVYIELPPYR
ncbi:hypothetical protein U1839_18070 [Sphingomonas sp. RT2P30]|uniref:hypothetical protein n=1 Tax=Parasphingomonas halimpatiens TaxID=3096162 RepID=UPI002FCBDF87